MTSALQEDGSGKADKGVLITSDKLREWDSDKGKMGTKILRRS